MAIRRLNRQRVTRRYRRGVWPAVLGAIGRRRLAPIVLTAVAATSLFAAAVVLWWSRDLPDPQNINSRQVAESTKIFDRTNTHLLYEIGDVKRTYVGLDKISPHLAQATVAAEDDRFYTHHGIDLPGIIRGVIVKPLSGRRIQGGSTITQQLIKNSILTPERTIRRKVKEAVLALELEQRFNKDEILTMYLNEIPYGSQAYGAEAAAQTFFGQPAAELSLARATALAALPKAPTYYSPYGSHFEDLKRRQENILQRMVDLNLVTQAEADQAKQEELQFEPPSESIQAPHFVFYIKEQLDAEYGERVVEQGGLVVTTTLDMRLQKIAEAALTEHRDAINKLGASNAALVAVDPKTGDILAMAGSIDYFDEEIDGNVNVTIRHRSPGSSIKPFVYAAAWQKGYTPETILIDAATDFGQGYKPKNYSLEERGPVTMRVALANSLNIPAVKTLYLAGVKNATDLAQRMGMASLNDPGRYGLSLVLGGGEIRLLDETSAYGVFANDGLRLPHRGILKVADGRETLFDLADNQGEATGEQTIPAELARLVTSVLSDNQARALSFGTRSYLQLGSRPVAAKTGTTQEFRDGWTLGYTPSVAAGVWVGNNDNTPMHKNAPGANTAAPIWNAFMREALAGTPIEEFVAPPRRAARRGILRGEIPEVKGKWDREAGIIYAADCPVALGQPTTFKEIHNILFYVRRDAPGGSPPANAEADPQFSRWEEGVAAWRDRHNEENKDNPAEPHYVDSLPTPVCEGTSPENLPRVRISEPNATVITDSPVTVKAAVDSPKPIKEVRFLLDGEEIARRGTDDPYQATFSFPNNFSGRKTILILAITENNLIGRAHRTFIINPDDSPPEVTLHTPPDGTSLKPDNFPVTVKVTARDNSGIELVDVLYQKDGGAGASRIGRSDKIAPTAPNRYEVTWNDSPGPGEYSVHAIAYDTTGNATESAHHTITID
jgi:1A family penicillin-binding protein